MIAKDSKERHVDDFKEGGGVDQQVGRKDPLSRAMASPESRLRGKSQV